VLLDKAKAAEILGVSTRTVARLLQKREIAFVQVRGRVRFTLNALCAYIKKATVSGRDESLVARVAGKIRI
jgi:excisionase family DNA binding protein